MRTTLLDGARGAVSRAYARYEDAMKRLVGSYAELWERAKDELDGLEPTLLVDGPAVVELIDSAAGDDRDWAKIKPYLEGLDVLASGSEKDDETARGRFAIGAK